MNTPTVSYTHRQIINTFRRAAQAQWEARCFTHQALCYASYDAPVARNNPRAMACLAQFRKIMHSGVTWDNNPAASDVRTYGLLLAAEFTRTEGLL